MLNKMRLSILSKYYVMVTAIKLKFEVVAIIFCWFLSHAY